MGSFRREDCIVVAIITLLLLLLMFLLEAADRARQRYNNSRVIHNNNSNNNAPTLARRHPPTGSTFQRNSIACPGCSPPACESGSRHWFHFRCRTMLFKTSALHTISGLILSLNKHKRNGPPTCFRVRWKALEISQYNRVCGLF